MNHRSYDLAVIGLGYVGLPLAVEFAKQRRVVGFDTNDERIRQLMVGVDSTGEVLSESLVAVQDRLTLSSDAQVLDSCNCFIVTVPTPVTEAKHPDMGPLIKASKLVGKALSVGNTIIFESTVYPGATEEVCVPELERESGLRFNEDFFVGYSPERINPGDKKHRLVDIVKVTSGSNPATAKTVDDLYKSIIKAGTFKASSIMVAEAAKVIENTQRDINIALVNELAIIFDLLAIDTHEVLEAAGSKWNFLPFKPGLVGGHCIGVDPYYLTHKAQLLGYSPDMILSGRKLNDSMPAYVAKTLVKKICEVQIDLSQARVLILGFSFKENCPDIRNTKVASLIHELKEFSLEVDVYDPVVDRDEVKAIYDIDLIDNIHTASYDAAIVAVGHTVFSEIGKSRIVEMLKVKHVLYDLKNVLAAPATSLNL